MRLSEQFLALDQSKGLEKFPQLQFANHLQAYEVEWNSVY